MIKDNVLSPSVSTRSQHLSSSSSYSGVGTTSSLKYHSPPSLNNRTRIRRRRRLLRRGIEGALETLRIPSLFRDSGSERKRKVGDRRLNRAYLFECVYLVIICVCFRPQNMIAQSQSGTGKTAAFTLATLSRIDESQNFPQVSNQLSKR